MRREKVRDFETLPSKLIHLDNEPIVSLNVTDHKRKQFIVATTAKKVYVVEFC